MKNILWAMAALVVLVLSFTLPLGDFRLSLNHPGRVSKPITKALLEGAMQESNCLSLEFELKSRALFRLDFWLGFFMTCMLFGLTVTSLLQPNSDRVLMLMGFVVLVITFTWLVYSFGQNNVQLGAGQVLYSSSCEGV